MWTACLRSPTSISSSGIPPAYHFAPLRYLRSALMGLLCRPRQSDGRNFTRQHRNRTRPTRPSFGRGKSIGPQHRAFLGSHSSGHYAQAEMPDERVEIPVAVQQLVPAFDASCGNHRIDGLANGDAEAA